MNDPYSQTYTSIGANYVFHALSIHFYSQEITSYCQEAERIEFDMVLTHLKFPALFIC